jgi:uncharacterized protein YqgC (DUF456 family)
MDIFILFVSIILILAGLILIILNFPGIWVVWVGIFVHAAYHGFDKVSILTIVIMFLICALTAFLDYVAIGFSSKKFGASKWGIAGAIFGGIVGFMIGNIFGLLLGPFLGALLAELIFAGKGLLASSKAGFGATLGIFLGITLDLTFALAMVVVWIFMIN